MPKICKHEKCNNFVFGGGYCSFHQFLRNKPKKEKPRKSIRRTSKKRREESEVYSGLRTTFLNSHSRCEANLHNCTISATEVHHKRGRGKYYLDVSTWIALCHNCHRWVTDNSKEAIRLGLSTSRLKK